MTASGPAPCAGLRVVELPGSAAAAYCGTLLAGLGADVVKVEPPDGDPLRGEAALFAAVNGGTSSRIVDPRVGDGELDELVAWADVVLVGRDHADLIDTWTARHPSLVVTVVTPFGTTGPRATWASTDLVQYAMALWMHATGRPEREPLAVGARLAETIPGLCAASATLMALRARRLSGRGQVVDVAQQEALLLCQPYFDLGLSYTGVERDRNGMPFPMTIVPAADGYLGVNVLTQTQWELLCAYTGRVDLLDDPALATPADRAPHAQRLTATFAEWAADKERVPVFLEGQEWRIPLGYVPHVDEVRDMAQHDARSFFGPVEDPASATMLHVPALPFLVDGARRPPSAPPGLGDAGTSPLPARSPDPAPADADLSRGPLTGITVVDLSMFWSGPLTTGLFAQYGADVIKVESVQRVDGWRGLAGAAGIEMSNLFNGVNVNKTGITLDLTSTDGRALLRSLVEGADVLVENFSTRVMGNFGLTDDVLHEWNPDLTILSMPAFGLTGPWQEFVGFAPTIEQLSGLPELTGYRDGPPMLTGNSIADPCAGLAGCFALLAALHDPDAAGGGHVDLSQLEALTSLLAPELVEQQLAGTPRRCGNSGRGGAHQGCYPARDPGTWIVLAVTDDDAWTALADVAAAGWAADPRFVDARGRREHADELDRVIGDWTSSFDNVELATVLQAAGVAAAPVVRPAQLLADDHLAARGSYQELDRAHVGRHRYPVLPFKFSATPGRIARAAPTLGQDNESVLGGRLGLSAERLAELREARVIGEDIDES